MKNIGKVKKSSNMIFTQKMGVSFKSKYRGNFHALVLGGSGAGKSYQYVMPNLLNASGDCSYVITDPKGELFNQYGRFLEKMGYKVRILNIDDMEHSCGYNPFYYLRNEDDITDMVQVFMENTQGNAKQSGSFWDDMSRIQLEGLCNLVYATYPKEKQNWFEVAELLRQAIPEKNSKGESIPTKVDILMGDINLKEPGHIAYLKWMDFKSIAKNDETVANAVGSTIARITRFSNKSIRKLTSIDTLDMRNIGKEPTAIFCLTKAVNETYNFLMGMCYMQMFQTLENVARTEGENNKLPIYTRFILDEFANICKIPKFDEWLSYIRSFGVSISVIIQSFNQLDEKYDKKAETIIENCDFTLFLGTTGEKSAERISKRLGDATIYRKERTGKNNSIIKHVPMQRKLMTTGEVLQIPPDKCVLFIARRKPVLDLKMIPDLMPNYKYTYSATKNPKDWYDTKDFPTIDEQYKEIFNKEYSLEASEQLTKEEGLVVDEMESKNKDAQKETDSTNIDLLEKIKNRKKNIGEEKRIDNFTSTDYKISEEKDLSEFAEEFSSKNEMQEKLYSVDFNMSYELYTPNSDDLIMDFINTATNEKLINTELESKLDFIPDEEDLEYSFEEFDF